MPTPTKPRYLIVRHQTTTGLVSIVNPMLEDGVWECLGAPFFEPERREWCQTIVRPVAQPERSTAKASGR